MLRAALVKLGSNRTLATSANDNWFNFTGSSPVCGTFPTLPEHKRLHRLMQDRFKNIISETSGKSMATSGGRSGPEVVNDFGIDRIKEELDKFYRDFPEFGC
ncbi:MAG: hypothetical protein ABJO45_06415 [Lentilitoribacter sp.]